MRFEKIISLTVVLVSMSSAKAVTDQGISEKLNRDIATKTGLSLKVAYEAVVGHDSKATRKLLKYAYVRGTLAVEEHYLQRVAEARLRCDKDTDKDTKAAKDMRSCELEVGTLEAELDQIRLANGGFAHGNMDGNLRSPANASESATRTKEKVFVASLIYYHQILSEVLEQEYAPFKARCGVVGSKSAASGCERETAQLSLATAAAMDLVRVASAHARGNADTEGLESELKLIIGPI